ncbi:solute carrier family 22 member 15-like [Anneissia japonica]|uniref:solute carrier family 22 member 15-like n=1 Tax=Anneissia japonica TaxID=1529436 RepID=UPI00142568EE|nr:solute carrier family 22 member 15-like [Anneissia japonica]
MDFDTALSKVGELGLAQIVTFILVTSMNFLLAFQQVNLAFIAKEPSFYCTKPYKAHGDEVCHLEGLCEDIQFGDEFTSIVSEFKLICGESYKTSLVQSIYMIGVLFGGLIWGPKSDAIGRKKTLMAGVILLVLTSILSGFTQSYLQFAFLKFINGAAVGGTGLVIFVYSTENIGASYRVFAGTLVQVVFALGISGCAGVAYYVRDWRNLTFITGIPFLFYLPVFWVLPESPRWLASKGKLNQAEALLFKMALRNKKEVLRKEIALARPPKEKKKEHQDKAKSVSYLDFFRTPNIRQRMLVQIFTWFGCSMVYLGLTMGAGDIGSNAYVSVALSGLAELPAYVACILLLDVIGRRIMLSGCTILGGLACMLLLFIPDNAGSNAEMLQTALALIGKIGVSASFNVVYIYSSELAPTSARSSALALCTMSARIGGALAPSVAPYGKYVMFQVFGLLSLTAGISSLLLPETLNQALPDTIEDIENYSTKKTQ